MTTTQGAAVLRYTAFFTSRDGGNQAGVVLDAGALGDEEMRAVAAEVGYSETAFLTPADGTPPPGVAPERAFTIRYFSPEAEVAFCGHSTVATAVALGAGPLHFSSPAGPIPVTVTEEDGQLRPPCPASRRAPPPCTPPTSPRR